MRASPSVRWAHALAGIAVDRIIGFEDLGGKDEFPTEVWMCCADCWWPFRVTVPARAR